MRYLLLFHCNNGYTNAPECYVIPKLPALLIKDKVVKSVNYRKSNGMFEFFY